MIRRVPLVGLLLLAAAPARAEDFSGFYAGVNAGYGRDHEETGAGNHPTSSAPAAPGHADAGTGLPPSASAAAATLRRVGPGRPGPGH